MTKIDKNLSESLFVFNNHIVSTRNVIKKSKILEIRKLIRKIKAIKEKKGNEAQLEKNKRKCENLKQEIQHIKNINFNDVAIFSLENDSMKLEDFQKTNKKVSLEEISLARVALSKAVKSAMEKLKNDPKIDGWKRTLIQYKSRSEKRKNWKEKSKLFKELDSKFEINNDKETQKDDEQDQIEPSINDHETAIDVKSSKAEVKNKQKLTSTPSQKESTIKSTVKQTKKVKTVKFSDDESSSCSSEDETQSEKVVDDHDDNDDSSHIDGYDSHDDDQWNNNEESTASDSESEQEQEQQLKTAQVFVYSADNLKKKNEPKATPNSTIEPTLKPLRIADKPAYMEIKQINLDELKEMDEIPVSSSKTATAEEDTSTVKTIKLNEDAFFLDEHGNEVFNGERFNPGLDYEPDDDSNYYNKRKRFDRNNNQMDFKSRRDYLSQSSFRSSLSSKSKSFQSTKQNYSSNYSKSYNDSNVNNTYKKTYQNKPTSFKSNTDNKTANFKPNEVDSKLHPSWQAKKQMEEKLKTLKFEGKKITFDD